MWTDSWPSQRAITDRIDASLKRLHSRGVAQNMGRDPFPLQRRARLPRDIHVFGKHVLALSRPPQFTVAVVKTWMEEPQRGTDGYVFPSA